MEKHFATLKLLDSDTDWKLTETFSYSKLPYSRQIHVNQMCESKSQSSLVRRYSCEQIFDNTDGRESKEPTDPCIDNYGYTNEYKSSNLQFSKSNNILQAPKFIPGKTVNDVPYDEVKDTRATNESTFSLCSSLANTSNASIYAKSSKFETVDTEVRQTDIKKNTNKESYEDVKKKYRPLVVKKTNFTKTKMNMCFCTCLTVCIVPVVTVIFALLINLNAYTVCNRAELFLNASTELQHKIYGQKNAVSSIVAHLDHDFFNLKVVCLIGGTGVGKSYTVEIIRNNFPSRGKIFSYDASLDNHIDAKTLSSLDTYRLFIVENMKMKHLDTFADIVDVISQTPNCLTVIAIFNIEEVNNDLERKVDSVESRNIIGRALSNKKIDFSVVSYEPLNEEALELCITQAASASGLSPTQEQIKEIKESLQSSGSGCKGAYAKLQVIGRY